MAMSNSLSHLMRKLLGRDKSGDLKADLSRQGERADRFNWIYEKNYWGDAESVSGPGSRLDYTVNLRKEMAAMVRDFNITSILDAPCGDFNWMRHFLDTHPMRYIGGDIVGKLVEANNKSYASDNVSFIALDITKDPLPHADMMMCRDCLFHLPERDVFAFFRNYLSSGIPYLFTTSHITPHGFRNTDIEAGQFRRINLSLPPYNITNAALVKIDDWIEPHPPRHMALYQRDIIAAAFS